MDKMQVPLIVRQMGNFTGENRVYIEDYVFSYLNEVKSGENTFPVRVALYGKNCKKGQKNFYFIYGAACVIEEMENGRDEEAVRKEYFEEYELIGYVNIYNSKTEFPGKKEGYCIFYEANEAMQNYLLTCYERRHRKQQPDTGDAEKFNNMIRAVEKKPSLFNEALEKIAYALLAVVLAIAISSVNDYGKLFDFADAVAAAAQEIG